MKVIKQIITSIANVLSKPFYFLAALASLVGFFIIFASDKDKVLWSFVFFNLLLLILIGSLIYSIFKLLNNSTTDFESNSAFIRYETLDGNKITHEVYKHIQCKRPILSKYEYKFKWSGTHFPIVTSDLQIVENVLDKKNPSTYDKAVLRFRTPLLFNENSVVHFRAELDDTDKRAEPYVSNRIVRPIDIIHYRVVLQHKEDNANAVLERRKIDSISNSFEKIKEIAFNKVSKSYEYPLLNPELGYMYRISWER